MAIPDRPVPVTILTGFLGAGKTTLLNYILKENHGYKYAVIINEVGKIGIDGGLVETRPEEIVTLDNGCLCCTVRADLIKGVQTLVKKGGFDYLLIETTGIADPGPVAQTFLNIPALHPFVRLDSIITVVDAENFLRQLADSEVAAEQVATADFVLVNKIDLVSPEQLAQIEAKIVELNPHASLVRTSHSQANLKELLDMNVFDVSKKLALDPDFLDEMKERSHGGIESYSFEFDRAFDIDRFSSFVEKLSETQKVLRSKGFLQVRGNPRRAIFHGVNNRFTVFWDRLWEKDETRSSQLVFIGKSLDRNVIAAGLERCLVK